MSLKSGDVVKNRHVDIAGKVLYGPFTSTEDYIHEDVYLVELLGGLQEGKAAVWPVSWVEALPKFVVGQKVRSAGVLHKVVAGPFTHDTGSKFYVLEAPDGSQDVEYEAYMVSVEE